MSSAILITGAAGNLGRKLTAHLRGQGSAPVLLDVAAQPPDPAIETADLSRWSDWADRFRGIDCVIHLAGESRPEAGWPSVSRHNIDATLNVFQAAARHGVRRIVFASTTWVMEGHSASTGIITEDMPPLPVNAYGASKLAGERIGSHFAETTALSVICLRLGACSSRPGNLPGRHLGASLWGQQKWLSDRDLCHGFGRAVAADGDLRFEIVNLVSANRGMRWDMGKAERLLGFRAVDESVPVGPRLGARIARLLK